MPVALMYPWIDVESERAYQPGHQSRDLARLVEHCNCKRLRQQWLSASTCFFPSTRVSRHSKAFNYILLRQGIFRVIQDGRFVDQGMGQKVIS
jgi:hypothetical protein